MWLQTLIIFMARYSLLMLKVPLNPTNQPYHGDGK